MTDAKTDPTPLMREPSFRWMMGGGALSMLGDQFTLIALPWLVLQMTADALTLGLVIALMGAPRAVFILIGGALVDRYSPKRVLMLTKHVNAVLLAVLAALVLGGQITLPLVFALALAIGLASAFSIPSGSSLLPHVVAPEQLQGANSVLMGMRQLSMLAGPLLAGALIAVGGHGAGMLLDARGLGLAFGFDALTFAVSAWTLSRVVTAFPASSDAPQAILRAVVSGLKMVWDDRPLRTCFAYWGAISFVVGGSMQVALPLLASSRLGGAAALGLLMGAHGCGSLLGMALSMLRGRLRVGTLGTTLLLIDAVIGALLMFVGSIAFAWQGALLMLTIGTLAGFMQIAVFTWIQRRVPRAMLGRAMSIFMFIFMGMAPLSAAITGALMRSLTLGELFAGAGAFLVGGALLVLLFTNMRAVVDPESAPAPAPTAADRVTD
jgi:MFS family permease